MIAAVPAASLAQVVSTTSVSGTITDATGAAVVGATITLSDVASSATQNTTSNDVGRYIFPVVQPGTYNLTVNKANFRSSKVSNQTVTIGTPLTLNIALTVGAATETIEVTATGTELQTLNATVGTTISHQELLVMPNLTRDTSSLVTLQPGVTFAGNSAGATTDQNTFILDGGPITDDMSGDNNTYIASFSGSVTAGKTMNGASPSGVIPTPVESIEEFNTSVTGQTADFNSSAGSEVIMSTKKGTDQFHGSLYEYYQDTTLGGANSFDNKDGATLIPIASAHYNRYGGTAGGPITRRNFLGGKWYVFGNYEGFNDPQKITENKPMPTPLLRSGMMFVGGQVINLNSVATAVPTGMPASLYSTMGVTPGQMIAPTTCPAGACDPRGLGLNPLICTASGNGGCSAGLWSLMPLPNHYSSGDTGNTAGYTGTLALPQDSNFGVIRVDHDFGAKWHFFSTYHYYHLSKATTNQVDVGGVFPGDTFGNYTSTSNRPQVPWYYSAGLSTDISTALTNNFTYSGTRNWWAYATFGGVPNSAGFPAAFEPTGENANDFAPYNTNNQSTRTRYWDGKDNTFGDNLTWLKGNHLLTLGGMYERSHETHQRIDNGGFINIYEQYLMGDGTSASFSSMGVNATTSGPGGTSYIPASVPSASAGQYANYYSMILGMVTIDQKLYTRQTGSTLGLNPQSSCAVSGVALTSACIASSPALNSSVVPTYNLYLTDSWKIKPTLTLTFGTGYTVEMPPFEPNGHQSVMVDQNGNQVNGLEYLADRNAAALQGVAFDPILGFSTIGDVKAAPKYPYNPYYKGFSPRVAIAWNPSFDQGFMGKLFGHNDTVIRGGWSRIFGRLNGVDQVLVPILAPGLMQTSVCDGPTISGTCGSTPATNFRVGVDGTTAFIPPASVTTNGSGQSILPQPWYPGFNDVNTGSGEVLDPSFKPDRSDEFNLSIQRQINRKIQFEVGYIGRIIKNEFEPYDLNAVPYNMTLGGETFAKAWANVMQETNFGANPANAQMQPFFEAALGGVPGAFAAPTASTPNGGYCAGFTSCTAAFVSQEAGNMGCACVWDAWTDVSTGAGTPSKLPSWAFGRSMINDPLTPKSGLNPAIGANGQSTDFFVNASNGYGNYNAAYFTLSFADWHGLSMRSNFTYGRAIGTGAIVQASSAATVEDAYNLGNDYGLQNFDRKYLFNTYFRYDLPFFRSQHGVAGKLLGGWSITPLLTAQSGLPIEVTTGNGNGESFGEGNTNNEASFESGVLVGSLANYTASAKSGVCGMKVPGLGSVATSGACQNVFSDPVGAVNLFAEPILGLDGNTAFPIYGLPSWNLDAAIQKSFKITERVGASVYVSAINVLNHMQPNDPGLDLSNLKTWGVLGAGGAVQQNSPRQLEWGLRVSW